MGLFRGRFLPSDPLEHGLKPGPDSSRYRNDKCLFRDVFVRDVDHLTRK
jgi:hypothetical protein